MAYLVQRGADRFEIRESFATDRGPRSRRLVSFRGALTPDVLERAAHQATRRFDPQALMRRARAAGIPVERRSREPEARALLARLRRGDRLDPVLAAVLHEALEPLSREPVPEALQDVAEWVGVGVAERGQALRELLDVYGRIAASRPTPRRPEPERFPRIESRLAS